MAATVPNDDERDERVQKVAEYVIQTGASYRQAAAYFTDNKIFEISYVTVADYCRRYAKHYPQKREELQKVIASNTEKTLSDEEVRTRVLNNANLLLEGLTIEEIAASTATTYWTVYRDLTERLPQVYPELAIQVQEKLQSNSHSRKN